VLFLQWEAQSPFGAVVMGASMVWGPNGHRRPLTKTTLVVWLSLGDFGLHGGGCEGVESIGDDEFLSGMFVFGDRVVVRPQRRLSSFLLRSRLLP
jgi:hypothetical protein